MHSSRMRTTHSLPYRGEVWGRGLCPGVRLSQGGLCGGWGSLLGRPPDRDPPCRNMGPGSQTGSDIIQRPPTPLCEQND